MIMIIIMIVGGGGGRDGGWSGREGAFRGAKKVRPRRGREGAEPSKSGGPEGGEPGGMEVAFFFSLTPQFFSFFLLLGVFSWNFCGVFEAPGP